MSATHTSRVAMALYSPVRLGSIFALLLLLAVRAFAGQATLAWDPSPDTAVTGYTVHYGQATKSYTAAPLDARMQTSFTVPNLLEGKTYYFAVTARDVVRHSKCIFE